MEQTVQEPNDADLFILEAKRRWVREHFTPETEHQYQELDQKLKLLDTILKSGWIEPAETVKLQTLGITLGDAFIQKMGFEWVTVEDEYGRDPAIRLPGTSLLLFPLTMISKRIENGEEVDIYDLFDGVCNLAEQKKKEYT
jgi:hypothetical protein